MAKKSITIETKDDCISKKTKIEEIETNVVCTNPFNLNFPLPGSSNVACLVKTYENFDDYKINGMYEFVGVLSQDPSLAYTYDEHGDSFHEQNQIQEKLIEQFKLNLNNEEEQVVGSVCSDS